MADYRISHAHNPLRGIARVPADKSISHRAVILAALAEGTTRIQNFLQSSTTGATLDCLRALGTEIQELYPTTLEVHGHGLHSLREPVDILFCKGSGTTMRLMAGVCAGKEFLSILDGTPALKRRPMDRVLDPLRRMGARVMAREGDRLPPLAIRGGRLQGIDYSLPVASAQVKSAILLAGLYADSPTTIREPAPSRDHSERMLRAFGVQVENGRGNPKSQLPTVIIQPPTKLGHQAELQIPNDFSSAAFLVVAALLVPGSEVCLERIGVNPTRTGLLGVLEKMGAEIRIDKESEVNGEPAGDLMIQAADGLKGTEVHGELVAQMIDEFPILAIAATQAHGETRVRDAAELKVKESDRIQALTTELARLGANIEPHPDGFTISGPTQLHGGRVHSHGDHRLAMSLAVAGLLAEGETTIEGWECVADSFPNFAETLSGLMR